MRDFKVFQALFALLALAATVQAQPGPSEWEAKAIEAINKERTERNLPPLKADGQLMTAARNYCATMAKLRVPFNKITHEVGGKKLDVRVKEVNYPYQTGGENAYASLVAVTPEHSVKSLMESDYHRSNILASRFMDVGVGVARGENGTTYVTQIFATRVGMQPARLYKAGALTNKSPLIKQLNKYHDVYSLKLKAGETVTIDLASREFDTFLVINDDTDKSIAYNDDLAKGNSNSRITLQAPREGTYHLIVTSYEKLKTGRFELTVH